MLNKLNPTIAMVDVLQLAPINRPTTCLVPPDVYEIY